MAKNIYLLLEMDGKNLSGPSEELLGAALRLLPDSRFIAIIPNGKKEEINILPLDKIYYGGEAYPQMASKWAKVAAALEEGDLMLAPMTVEGREFASAFAAEKGFPYITAVSAIEEKPEGLLITRITYSGLAQEEALLQGPLVLGLTPGIWGAASLRKGKPELIILSEPPCSERENIAIEKTYTADFREMGIDEGDMVVAGGMGMETKEKFTSIDGLGEALSAPVGGSRVAEDKGWIDHSQMIGATGHTIAPRLYIACGISGAVQHIIGVQGSRHIIAINNDPTAAMMSNADLAVNGDAYQIIKELTDLLKDYSPLKEG